jgi:enoyl-CoA hydratase
MAGTVTLERDGAHATLRLSREHGNAINQALVEDLASACERLAADDTVCAVTLAASGKLFCPGLDLIELIDLDRPTFERFVERFTASVLALYSLPKPLLAAIHGHAIAGGCVLALTADWRVLHDGASVGLNEIRVGVPLPFGVAAILRESTPRLAEVALLGRNYRGGEAVAAGLVHEVATADDFDARCRERAEELAAKDPRAFALTKRYLRAAAIERIRAHEAEHLDEFVSAWFAEATRARIAAIVEGLGRRG